MSKSEKHENMSLVETHDSITCNSTSNNSSNPAILVQLPDSSTNVIIKEEGSATVDAEENASSVNFNLTNNSTGLGNSSNLRVSFGGGRRADLQLFRAPSPISTDQHFFLTLPQAGHSGRSCTGSISEQLSIGGDVGVCADEKTLIKSLEILADALGVKKSFSTNDILGICLDKKGVHNSAQVSLQRSQSEMKLSEVAPLARIEASSRSLSTWVAVGDTSATTQLPSPQARMSSAIPNFTPADLVRSVNKRIRQSYLRKRLLTSYKALERMSVSGINIEKLQELIDETGKISPELARLFPLQAEGKEGHAKQTHPLPANKLQPGLQNRQSSNDSSQTTLSSMVSTDGNTTITKTKKENNNVLSPREVERDRGKPLSKYERNVMIFDWLHTLDENATIDLN